MTINRYVGPTLVNATWGELVNCITLGGYPVLKVVPTNQYGLYTVVNGVKKHEDWDDTNRLNVCNLTRWTIVRTQTGNHTMIDENLVYDELAPWYRAKKGSRFGINPQPGYSNLLIELGNEPNNDNNFCLDSYIWNARWHLMRAIDVCRRLDSDFQVTAKLICTALAPRFWYEATATQNPFPGCTRPRREYVWRWLELFANTGPQDGRNVVNECNFVGVHFFSKTSWTGDPNDNNMRFMIEAYNRYIGSRRYWILTEFGLKNPINESGVCDDFTKGYRNAGMLHFNEGPGCVLPSHVWGGTYFKLSTWNAPSDTDIGYAYYYPNGDWSYRNRLNSGS